MDQFANLLQRPRAYYNIDGVGELGIGFLCLGYSLLQWLQVHTPGNSMWNQMYTFVIYWTALCAIIHYGSKAIKKRITYPRTGFISYRRRDTVWIPLIAGCVVAVLASTGLMMASRAHWKLTAPGALLGLLLAASYARGIARTVHWKWGVAFLMSAGTLAIAFLPPRTIEALYAGSWVTHLFPSKYVGAFWLCLTLYGVLLFLSGGISFYLYLRHTTAPTREEA